MHQPDDSVCYFCGSDGDVDLDFDPFDRRYGDDEVQIPICCECYVERLDAN